MVNRITTNIYQKENDSIRVEYGNIVQESVIPKDTDASIEEVWNFYTNRKVPNPDWKNCGKKPKGRFRMMKNKYISQGRLQKR